MNHIVIGKLPERYEDELAEKLASLSRQRAEELQNRKNRKEFAVAVYASAAVFDFAAAYLNTDRDALIIEKSERGKPCFRGIDRLFFSISHSFPYYAVAFSERSIGVDIEKIRNYGAGIPERMFTENEKRYAGTDPGRFFEIWTKKEAYSKYTGMGVFSGFRSFDVLLPPLSDHIKSERFENAVISVCTEDTNQIMDFIFDTTKEKGESKMYNTKIDISHIPFSRYGAYAAISATPANEERTLFNELTFLYSKLRGDVSPIFSVKIGLDEPQEFECVADPTSVTVKTDSGSAIFYIRDDDSIVVESNGLDMRLDSKHNWAYGSDFGNGELRLLVHTANTYATLYVLEGCGKILRAQDSQKIMYRDMEVRCAGGRSLFCVTMSLKQPKDLPDPICPEKDLENIRAEWEAFAAQMENLKESDEKTNAFTLLTWYNIWSSFVRAEDVYKRDTMLMSKKGMSAVWSWDHCFNALALARCRDTEFAKSKALDQFSAPFWLQTKKGILPDMWNPHNITKWGITKPPIHGWCFSRLMDRFEFSDEELKTVYGWLEALTNWWTENSDSDRDGIPEYPMGCDSGWDNSTLFDLGYFVETPDLPTFLVLQMNTLARIARRLGNEDAAASWEKKAKVMLDCLIEHSWNGEHFVAKLSHTHEHQENPTSLLALMPIVLADMLPKDILDKQVKILEENFLTDNGLATEMPSSREYNHDGYWRGPIWAPSTYLMVDGLNRGGYKELAKTIAARYCRMSSERAHGNYENFDALTGEGLRAPGYTWSASVYMILRGEYDV